MADKMKPRILYVDDEVKNLHTLKASLRRYFNVITVESVKKAYEVLKEIEICVILSDQRMPEITGVEFFTSIKESHPDPIRMLITGYSDIDVIKEAINSGQVYKYLEKPWELDNLIMNINQAVEVYNLRKENKELTNKLLRVNKQLEFMLREKLL